MRCNAGVNTVQNDSDKFDRKAVSPFWPDAIGCIVFS
jgi:hypothetical protein